MSNRAQPQALLSPKGPMRLPCRSRSFLPINGPNKAQRAPSLPDHRTCGQDFASDKCQAKSNRKRLKPVAVLNRPDRTSQEAGCPWHRLLKTRECAFRTTYWLIIIVPPLAQWYQREGGFCGLFPLSRPKHMTHLLRCN